MVDVDDQVTRRQLPDQVTRHDPLGRGEAPHPDGTEQLPVGQDQQTGRRVGESAGE